MKKIFSFVVVMAAVAMVSCCGNSNKKAAESGAAAAATEASACAGCFRAIVHAYSGVRKSPKKYRPEGGGFMEKNDNLPP